MCTNRTALSSERQQFVANFLDTMDIVSPLIARQRYAAVVNGTQNLKVYTFGECMKDLSQPDCNLCFARCKTRILSCLPFQKGTRGGKLFYDGCYLRGNVSVYGLAQCWEFVNASACRNCLAEGVDKIGSCPSKEEGRVLNAGCYLRYSTFKFYNNSQIEPTGSKGGRRHLAVILAATSSSFALLLVLATATFFWRKKVLMRRREKKQLGALVDTVNKSKLNIPYEILETATNYFANSNKLGQGGSGSVYKGVLPDGKTVAVKRLFFNTRQWVDHFFNEVNLISGIYHKNLVQLLGCSITGPESLLVYEYVPNQSLHDFFVVKKNAQPLTWEMRCKIVLGTAEGLAYLHEESQVRIIHRDIKLSNILLDEDFTPRIADFGLARLFPDDKTHISTAIAGTLGYMAPEYVVRGKLTEKADVYSFGVLVIEVVSGKRNNAFAENSSSILQMVWSLYGAGRLCDAIDPLLEGNFEEENSRRILQIALLCVQASAELRPSMSVVVKMLTDEHKIYEPTQPPFLNLSNAETSQLTPPQFTSNSQPGSHTQSSGNSMTQSWIEPR
ncbi:putative Kinase [Quillaja saponaria]|uniref:Kinase n=1 Tax=Quillaja saponaria TaxID=32244 RepID=A0AAD7LA43_QUISA|nr:putative Kinase [Quillaja saponaria]